MSLRILIGLALLSGCTAGTDTRVQNDAPTADALAKRLVAAGYPDLFQRGQYDLIAEIWQDGKNRATLEGTITNPASSLHAKFLAAEVLRHYNVTPKPQMLPLLAEAYATALQHTSAVFLAEYHLSANLWGFLYEEDDAGDLGQRLISFGDVAIPHLLPLLDDAGPVLYEGSEEATLGNSYDFRIQDFAAFYLGKMRNIPLQYHRSRKERDVQIALLKQKLANRAPVSATPTSADALAKRLVTAGYPELFQRGEHDLAAEMWQDGKNRGALEQIIADPATSMHAKFLAAEVLRRYGVSPESEAAPVLAEAYATALKNSNANLASDYRLSANLWGFLYELDDPGYLGQRLIGSGAAAMPFLMPLLDDAGPVLYEGSREATMGNEYNYRIKDFAAYYIGKIRDVPVGFHRSLQERDAEIQRLKWKLKGG